MTANYSQCRPTTTNAGQWIPMKAHSSWCRPTNRDGPNDATCHLDPGMFLFFLFIHLLMIFHILGQCRPMKANDSQHRPTQANKYQCIPTKARSSQCQPTNGDRDGPKWCNTSFGPQYVFILFLFIYLLMIFYILSQCKPTIDNDSQCRPTNTNAYQ